MENICKSCQGDLSFISYKRDRELDIIYLTYRCDECGEIIEMACDNTDDELLRIVLNNNAYDRFMF